MLQEWKTDDYENHTCSPLRAVSVKRRLSFSREFGDKNEQSTNLKQDDVIETRREILQFSG